MSIARAPGEMLSVGQVAKRLGVTRGTVSRWCLEGKLTATRTLGKHYRITVASVEALVASLIQPAS